MTIKKRTVRMFRKKLPVISGCIILCTVSVMFLISSTTAGSILQSTVDDFFEETNVEDAQFTSADEISQAQIDFINDTYGAQVEQMQYSDYDEKEVTIRVFKESKDLNLYQLVAGEFPAGNTDILLSEPFAQNNNYQIGEHISIAGITYTITGYFTRPDYLYCLKSTSDTYMNMNFGIALISSEAFSQYSNSISYYSIKYTRDNSIEVRNYLQENYQLTSYMSSDKNPRIYTGLEQGNGVRQMGITLSPVLFILTIGFVAIIISKLVQQDKKEIGTLAAFGYTGREISMMYMGVAFLIAICGTALGVITGLLITEPFIMLYAGDYNFPLVESSFIMPTIIVGALIPIILLVTTALLVSQRMLKQDVISLLRNTQNIHTRRQRNFLVKSSLSNNIKYSARMILRNKGRTLIFSLGILIAAALVLLGLIMNTSLDRIIQTELSDNANYEYIYNLDEIYTDEYAGDGETLISVSLEDMNTGTAINIIGIETDSQYYDLYDISGNSIDVDSGFYVSRALSELLGISTGDSVVLVHPVTTQEYSVDIAGIIDLNRMKTIFSSRVSVNELMDYRDNSYNTVINDQQLQLEQYTVLSMTRNSELAESLEAMMQPVKVIVILLILVGVVLGILMLFMVTSTIVEDNRNNISVLKVLGYKSNEISKMVFCSYKYIVLLSYLIAIPLMLVICQIAFIADIEAYNMYIPASISMTDIFISALIVMVSYYCSLSVSKRKVLRINMVESLKMHEE